MSQTKKIWMAAWAVSLAGMTGLLLTAETRSTAAQATKASRPEGEAEQTGGVVVEEVSPGSALEAAGIRAGDHLLSWKRLARPPANPEGAQGDLESPFDWWWLEIEQAPRGTVRLSGERQGELRTWTVEPGLWEAKVRPWMPRPLAATYLRGRDEIQAGRTAEGIESWRQVAERIGKPDDGRWRCWLLLRTGQEWSEARAWDRAQAAYREAIERAREPRSQAAIWDAIGRAFERQSEMERALEAYRSAMEIREAAWTGSLSVAESKDLLGSAESARGELDAAETLWRQALDLREKLAPQSLALAESLNKLGVVASVRGDLAGAQTYYRRAFEIRTRLAPNSLDMAESFDSMGNVSGVRGDLEEADVYFRRAFHIREKLAPDSLVLAESLNNLGKVAWRRSDLDGADDYFLRAFQVREKLSPHSLDVASSLNNLGIVAVDRGKLAAAESYFLRALKIREELSPNSIAVSLDNLGVVAAARGDLVTAEARHRRAFEIREKLAPDNLDLAASFINLGNVAWKARDFVAAETYFQRALEIRERLAPNRLTLADVFNNLGAVAADRGDLTAAEDYHRRALDIRKELVPDSLHLAASFNNLGHVAWKRGDLSAAEDYFRQALEIEDELAPNSLELALSCNNLGNVAMDSGDLTQAEAYYQRALGIIETLAPNSAAAASTLQRLGGLSRKLRLPRRAEAALNRAILALEGQVLRLGSLDLRDRFRAQYREIYRQHLEVLLELDRPEEAFHTLERSRARGFLEMLAERDIVFPMDLSGEMESELRGIAAQYDRVQREIASSNPEEDGDKVKALVEEREELYRKRNGTIERIRRTSPEIAALRYPQALDFDKAQEALDSGTTMLSYSVGEKSTEVFVIAREEPIEVETVSIGEEELRERLRDLNELIPNARPGVETGEVESFRLLSKQLYGRLIEPVADAVARSERLLVVPDGPLHLLPWSALIRDAVAGDDGTGRSWQYLVEWKPLHIVLSATVYAELQRIRRRESSEPTLVLAAFGDALYPGDPRDLADVRVRSAVGRGLFADWQTLPHTRREVKGIGALFPPAARRTYLGAEATEEAAKAVGREPRIVHFATHGHLDDRFPLDSALIFTVPSDPGEDRDNGMLQVWEIFESVRLDADLVVLSACASALGEEQSGEGLIGLTRAFQYAGARSVVASLWSVQDRATSELMIRFYRHLRDGLPKDEALRAAQMELIRAPIEVTDGTGGTKSYDDSAPYSWAAFQVYGDWK